MTDRTWCKTCERWVGGGIAHDEAAHETHDMADSLDVGEYTLVEDDGGVIVYNDDEEVGRIPAAGLGDAARIHDECLSYIGSLEWFRQKHQGEDS
jgi:hypothetical protein